LKTYKSSRHQLKLSDGCIFFSPGKNMGIKVLQSYLMHGWHSKVPVPFLLGQLGNGSPTIMLQVYLMKKLVLPWESCSQKPLLFIQE
jgi:hypothetical protein